MQGWEERSQDQDSRLWFSSCLSSSIPPCACFTTAKAECRVQWSAMKHSNWILTGESDTWTPHTGLSHENINIFYMVKSRLSVICPVFWLIAYQKNYFVGRSLWGSSSLITTWHTCMYRLERPWTHPSVQHSTITVRHTSSPASLEARARLPLKP